MIHEPQTDETQGATFRLEDVVDIPLFQVLQDRLNEIYSFPSAIIDNDGNILTATAWQDVCTKFHRGHPECRRECIKSDQYILEHLDAARPAVTYRCPHGLVDNATPIVIAGRHVANYFTGQFFLEPPDLGFFERQAEKYGFDPEAYLAAVRKVPIWPQRKLEQYLEFIKGFVEVLAGIGHKNLQEREARARSEEASRAVRTLEASMRMAIAATGIGTYSYDFEHRSATYSPEFLALYGLDPDGRIELDQDMVPRSLHPEDRDGFLAAMRGANDARGPGVFDHEFRVILPDGTSRWLRVLGRTAFGEADSRPLRANGIIQDVTARRRSEEDLQNQRWRLASIIEGARVGTWEWNVPSGATVFNETWASILGYTLAELEPTSIRTWETLTHPQDLEAAGDLLERHFRGESPYYDCEFRMKHKDGHWVWIHDRGRVITRAPDGGPLMMFGTHTDITRRKEAETALATVQKLESLGTLAGGIAHDYNNLLTAILGNLSLVEAELGIDGRCRELIHEAQLACGTAKGLSQQLLTFARGGNPVVRVVDLRQVVIQAADFAARGSSVRCVFALGERPLAAGVDRDQIAQVIQNLVINAVQAMPRGGEVTLRAEVVDVTSGEIPALAAGKYVRVSVRDQGEGIPAAHLPLLFDPYFTTKEQGRGLGLSVCHSVMAKHGGSIGVDTRTGIGSVFTLHFPAARAEDLPPDRVSPSAASGRGAVLVMDDEPAVARILGRMLTRLGYDVEAVAHGEAAVEAYGRARAVARPFDVVIMDLTIRGGRGGMETLQALRAIDPGVKAIVSSGYANDPILADWSGHGFSGVLGKPYYLEEVSEAVRKVLEPAGK